MDSAMVVQQHVQLEGLTAKFMEPRWYAVYTCANHEKRVAEQFGRRSIEHFLPLYESVRRWKDRRIQLQLPLFPGYVFVRMQVRDRLNALQVPGVVCLVSFNGLPAPLPESEMDALRNALGGNLRAEPHPYLTVGRRVRIKGGPLAGFEGVLARRKGNFRVVLSLDLVKQSIALDIDSADLEPIFQNNTPGRCTSTKPHVFTTKLKARILST